MTLFPHEPLEPLDDLQSLQLSMEEKVHRFSQAAAAQIDRAAWRMISTGQLFCNGWRLGVRYELTLERMSVTCMPIPPGGKPPAGDCWTLINLSSRG